MTNPAVFLRLSLGECVECRGGDSGPPRVIVASVHGDARQEFAAQLRIAIGKDEEESTQAPSGAGLPVGTGGMWAA